MLSCFVLQLQGLLVELRQGLRAALTELSELRQRDHDLEEKLQAHQTDVDDKIMGLKNSLNSFKVLQTPIHFLLSGFFSADRLLSL